MTFRKARISGEPGHASGKFTSSSPHIPSIPAMPDQVPIFLIPGILGNAAEYRDLIETLRDLGDYRDIYIWCNPQIIGNLEGANYDQSSLQKQALLIAKSMRKISVHYSSASPYLIAGYSYGCSLAALVADELKKNNADDVELYLIDGPSPDCAKKYFLTPSLSLTTDLASVVKYAASLSAENIHFKEENIILTPEYLNSLVSLTPAECIDKLAEFIIKNCLYIDIEQFQHNIKIAKQDIYNIINSPDHLFESKFHKIISLITNQTAAKYGEFGGWKKHAEELYFVDDPLLINQDHRAILKQDREYNNLLLLKDEPKDGKEFDDQTIAILKKAKEISVYRTIKDRLEVHVLPKENVDKKILDFLEKNSSEKGVDTVIIEFIQKSEAEEAEDDEALQNLISYFTLKCGYSNISKLARSIEKFITQEVKLRTPLMLENHMKALEDHVNILEDHVNILLATFCPVGKNPKINSITQLYETASQLHYCNTTTSCIENSSTTITKEKANDTQEYAPPMHETLRSGKKRSLDLTSSGSSTKIASFSDTDSSADEESDNNLLTTGKINSEKYYETVAQLYETAMQLKLMRKSQTLLHRHRLFSHHHICGKENNESEIVNKVNISNRANSNYSG